MVYDQAWRRFGLFTGWMCIVVGVTVLGLWLTVPDWVARAILLLFQMKANTAVSMIGLGAACLLILRGRRMLALVLLVPIFLFGLAVLIQHLSDIRFGIDELLTARHFDSGIDARGQVAPNTAVCLLLICLSMIVRAVHGRSGWVQTSLAFLCFNLAAAALVGYMIALNSAHDWISGTRMSLQSAICFLCLSLTFAFHDAPRLRMHRAVLAGLMAISTYVILLAFTYQEMVRIESVYMMPIDLMPQEIDPRFKLSALVIISGVVYTALVSLHLHGLPARAPDGTRADGPAEPLFGCRRCGGRRHHRHQHARHHPQRQSGLHAAVRLPAGRDGGQQHRHADAGPHRQAHDRYLDNYHRTGITSIIGAGREVEGRRKDGSQFPIDASVVRIDLPDGTLFSGTLRDISQRKAHERAILAANAELEEFAYRTSHDLRAPIASAMA